MNEQEIDKAGEVKMKTSAASELMTLTAQTARESEEIADKLCAVLSSVMRGVEPIKEEPLISREKEYPPLFANWASHIHAIRDSLLLIKDAIQRTEL